MSASSGDRFPHVPVLLDEVIRYLALEQGDVVLDGTVGSAGHSAKLVERVGPRGLLLGLDRDREILPHARRRLATAAGRFHLVWALFSEIPEVLERFDVAGSVAGMLFDLGVSSLQFDRAERGFSFDRDAPLDLRMGRGADEPASALVNRLGVEALVTMFEEFGEEPRARAIAEAIVQERGRRPVVRTRHLAEIVDRVAPRRGAKIHPATRTFQALRIAVNHELDEIDAGLAAAFDGLRPGGRLAVISFQSLEDRLVKRAFKEGVRAGRLREVVKGALKPSAEERRRNRRSRSAKLRVVEVVGAENRQGES